MSSPDLEEEEEGTMKSHQATIKQLQGLAAELRAEGFAVEAAVASALAGGLGGLRLSQAAEDILRRGEVGDVEACRWIARDITADGGTPEASGWVHQWINREARRRAVVSA